MNKKNFFIMFVCLYFYNINAFGCSSVISLLDPNERIVLQDFFEGGQECCLNYPTCDRLVPTLRIDYRWLRLIDTLQKINIPHVLQTIQEFHFHDPSLLDLHFFSMLSTLVSRNQLQPSYGLHFFGEIKRDILWEDFFNEMSEKLNKKKFTIHTLDFALQCKKDTDRRALLNFITTLPENIDLKCLSIRWCNLENEDFDFLIEKISNTFPGLTYLNLPFNCFTDNLLEKNFSLIIDKFKKIKLDLRNNDFTNIPFSGVSDSLDRNLVVYNIPKSLEQLAVLRRNWLAENTFRTVSVSSSQFSSHLFSNPLDVVDMWIWLLSSKNREQFRKIDFSNLYSKNYLYEEYLPLLLQSLLKNKVLHLSLRKNNLGQITNTNRIFTLIASFNFLNFLDLSYNNLTQENLFDFLRGQYHNLLTLKIKGLDYSKTFPVLLNLLKFAEKKFSYIEKFGFI